MIPIKGYATFHPLKHCWVGSGFKEQWFSDLPIYNNDKIMDPLKRISEETEEDYVNLEKILKDAGVVTHRSFLDIEKYGSLKNINRPPVNPRDHFAVIGEKLYTVSNGTQGYADVLKQIDRKQIEIRTCYGKDLPNDSVSTATITRVGKDLFWDVAWKEGKDTAGFVNHYKNKWIEEGFRVHVSRRGYHNDGSFCVVKPGCIVTLYDIQDYSEMFPNWEVLYIPDQSFRKVDPFLEIKNKVGGRWWLKGEEHNDQLIDFINTWLNDWVGFVEETVFDVNMLSLDENTIICNNYNKDIFDFLKKHKVEPIIFNFRHRYFWDGGIHCITQDLYREGTMEDYFG